jgi:sigma-E factor negative regulatory protein RseA
MKTEDSLNQLELVSALVDGQLRGKDFAALMELVGQHAEVRAAWHDYHLVGQVLRSGERMDGVGDPAFVASLRGRLQGEVIGTPLDRVLESASMPEAAAKPGSANEPVFRWKLVAGFASLAAVVAIGWNAVNLSDAGRDSAKLASASAPPTLVAQPLTGSAGEPQVMIRDPRLDELLAAHKQLGGTSALQMPAGFLRNATFEGPGR